MGEADPHGLAAAMASAALDLQAAEDRPRTLEAIVEVAVTTVPGADGAGIALIERRRITTAAPTGPLSARLHEWQVELDEGPCLDSLREQHTLVVDDLTTDERWPRLARRAAELGICSILSYQLYVHGDNLGALDLYAHAPGAFKQEAVVIGELFARHASVALAEATHVHHLNSALANRDVIGQAKGVLMQRDGISAQQAFNVLVRVSQQVNMKLADVARWLVREAERRASH